MTQGSISLLFWPANKTLVTISDSHSAWCAYWEPITSVTVTSLSGSDQISHWYFMWPTSAEHVPNYTKFSYHKLSLVANQNSHTSYIWHLTHQNKLHSGCKLHYGMQLYRGNLVTGRPATVWPEMSCKLSAPSQFCEVALPGSILAIVANDKNMEICPFRSDHAAHEWGEQWSHPDPNVYRLNYPSYPHLDLHTRTTYLHPVKDESKCKVWSRKIGWMWSQRVSFRGGGWHYECIYPKLENNEERLKPSQYFGCSKWTTSSVVDKGPQRVPDAIMRHKWESDNVRASWQERGKESWVCPPCARPLFGILCSGGKTKGKRSLS